MQKVATASPPASTLADLPAGMAARVMACALILAGCQKPKPAPSIDGLSAALQRTADQTLAAPPLANEQVILPAAPERWEALAGEVLSEAAAAGGVGIRSATPDGGISILATIPDNNADAFKAALRHEKSLIGKPSPTTRLIEVLIQSGTASPTP